MLRYGASRGELLCATAFLVAVLVILTWPQALYFATQVPDHDDPFLSMWRLGWIAHALPRDIEHLFDGNIFSPHVRTLAFSDATLFEGLLAAPWLWAHVNPVLVYNVLVLVGIVSSGVGMFVLVRHLTHSADAALVAATIFTCAPYRIEHYMHLELQWAAWMPLTFWAVHRIFEKGLIRHGLAAGALLALQAISCLYYGAYLAIVGALQVVLLGVAHRQQLLRAAVPVAAGVALSSVIVVPYLWPYIENARVLGPRDLSEIASFSAQLGGYLAAPPSNWVWGWTGWQFSGNELRVFPGAAAFVLAGFGVAQRPRCLPWIYAALAAVAVELSLGLNGQVYSWFVAHVWVVRAFRAPARFAILACCCLAVVAGFGFERLRALMPARIRPVLLALVLVAIALESGSGPMLMMPVPTEVPSVYRFLARMSHATVIELPIAGDVNPLYMFWSTRHWHSLVNGYSGYKPPDYAQTVARMRTFPDRGSIAHLQELSVEYIVVHESYYALRDYTAMILKLSHEPRIKSMGRFSDWRGAAHVFQLKPAAADAASLLHGHPQGS